MENNENNFQNEVKKVENEVKTAQEKKKTKQNGKGKKVLLGIILLVVFLLLGILAGVMIPENNKPEFVKKIEDKITNQENKDSKKIDESKPWVYDAEYMNDKEEKEKTNSYNNLTYKASEEIKLPYININSEDAKKANEELKAMFDKAYENFGKLEEATNLATGEKIIRDDWFSFTEYKYDFYENNNILSIVIKKLDVHIPGDGGVEYVIYNFNLDTLKFATLEEVGKACGFSSESDIKEKIGIAMENAGEEAGIFEDTVWDGKRFFIDKVGKLNVVLPGPAYGEITLEVDKNIERVTVTEKGDNKNLVNDNNAAQDQANRTDFSFMVDEGFKDVTYVSERVNNGYLYKIVFDEKGNPTISVEYIPDNMYGIYNSFYDIVQSNNWPESGIETASFKFKDLNGNGSEQNGTIQYSLVTNNETIELKLTVPYGENVNKGITLYKASTYTRPDNTNRSSGKLTITNFRNESFDFEINATHVNGENIEESIARGGINLGDVSGTAKKISEGKYQFVPDENEELMKYYESEYKIEFNIKADNSIEVKEIYDDAKYSQGPYAGAGIRFTGVYSK